MLTALRAFKASLHEKLKRRSDALRLRDFLSTRATLSYPALYCWVVFYFSFYCVALKTIYCHVASFAAVYWVEELPDNSNNGCEF